MNILYTYSETIVDGEGIRYSIYFAGCPHNCKGCHNPSGRDPKAGKPLTDEMLTQIISEINNNPLLDGITLSGVDPFYDPKGILPVIKRLKAETGLSIWCYTGYLYEDLKLRPDSCAVLDYIDVLVDGPFIESKYLPTLSFKGSTNQRILDLSKYKQH